MKKGGIRLQTQRQLGSINQRFQSRSAIGSSKMETALYHPKRERHDHIRFSFKGLCALNILNCKRQFIPLRSTSRHTHTKAFSQRFRFSFLLWCCVFTLSTGLHRLSSRQIASNICDFLVELVRRERKPLKFPAN